MAFDSKKVKTCKWINGLAVGKRTYMTKALRSSLQDVFVYCGSLYATDDIILAKIDYPEFEHLSDYEWSVVDSFFDDRDRLLSEPKITLRNPQFKNNRIFDDIFIQKGAMFESKIDPRVIEFALRPFKINQLRPNVFTDESRIEFTAHDKDISLRVLMMGVR